MQARKKEKVRKRKVAGAHFTPSELATFIADRLLGQLGQTGEQSLRVLDPSCGDGELLLAMQRSARGIRDRLILIGVEADGESLKRAEQRLGKGGDVHLIPGDFLALTSRMNGQPSLFGNPPLPPALQFPADVIIANPPYVRTQILGAAKSQALSRTFGLTGRVDLYHAFVVAMTSHLACDGLLGIITSNRFLTTRGGASLREFFAREYRLVEVVDLGDTKLFEAAVLPAVLFGRRRCPNRTGITTRSEAVPFIRIYESLQQGAAPASAHSSASVCGILESAKTGHYLANGRRYDVTVGHLPIPSNHTDPWAMVTDEERSWLKKVEFSAAHRVGDLAKVRVGIKTTADSVFIRPDWDQLPENIRPESELLRPLLSQDNAARWRAFHKDKSRRLILYPHTSDHGRRSPIDLDRYPRASAYLELHRKQLEGREYVREAGRNWYEIWVPQDPDAWELPKLVFPDISLEPRFFHDSNGCLVDGNCYWITLLRGIDEDALFVILAAANSRLMAIYHDLAFQNKLYSGRRRHLTQYVAKYPLPRLDSPEAKRLAFLGRCLVFDNPNAGDKEHIEQEMESVTARGYGL